MPDGTHRPTHLDAQGRARMVDVGDKDVTSRVAVAYGRISMRPETARAIGEGTVAKGDVLAVARVAGIQAAKETSRTIPLCHSLPLDAMEIVLTVEQDGVVARVTARTRARTGVEMEALVGTSAALLTLYDMCKGIDRGMEIGPVRLEEKHGGESGSWTRSASGKRAPEVGGNE